MRRYVHYINLNNERWILQTIINNKIHASSDDGLRAFVFDGSLSMSDSELEEAIKKVLMYYSKDRRQSLIKENEISFAARDLDSPLPWD